MRVVQTVFGVFHHFELAHQLARRGCLSKLYTTWPWLRVRREGLPRELVGTFPLLHAADHVLAGRAFYPDRVSRAVRHANQLLFDRWTERVAPPCDVLVTLSGGSLRTGARVQREGGRFVCDRGSTHHRFQAELLRRERRLWGVPDPLPEPAVTAREEAIYAQADAISVPSGVARSSFVAMGVAPEKLHVIPYGARLERFLPAPAPLPAEPFEVLFAGQLSVRKGLPYALETFARLRHPRKRLTLAGPAVAETAALLARLPTAAVERAGVLPQPELARRMAASHVLLLPSVEEGLAMTMAQALAAGCPVLATEATGARDLFTDGVEGFLVPDRDVDALHDRLERLAGDPALERRMSEAAHRSMQARGGWDAYGDLWAALLHTLTGL